MIEFSEEDLDHIFRNKRGHLDDTEENRQMLKDLVADERYRLGTDTFGKIWYGRTRGDGKQEWAAVYGGIIRNGGLNETVLSYVEGKGLMRNAR